MECGGLSTNDDGSKNPEAATVADCEEFFAKVCFQCDQILGEPAACRFFLNPHDELPRDEVRRGMLTELNREIALRSAA
jgi:hypothetical protein